MSKNYDNQLKNLGPELRLQIDREINSMATPDWETIFCNQAASDPRKVPPRVRHRALLRIAAFLALAVISYGGVKAYQSYTHNKILKLEIHHMVDRIFAESIVKDMEFRLADNYKDVSDWLQELESSTDWYLGNENNNYFD